MAYADVAELARLLEIRSPTQAQTDAMGRALEAAATEIDWELGYTADSPAPSPPPALVVTVNLERAREHWNDDLRTPGVIMIGDSQPIVLFTNPWNKYRRKLMPLKTSSFGVA